MLVIYWYSLESITIFFRFTNNVLSTAQQVWLRKMGGAKPLVNENAGGIISAGRAKRSGSQPEQAGGRLIQRAKSFLLFLLFLDSLAN